MYPIQERKKGKDEAWLKRRQCCKTKCRCAMKFWKFTIFIFLVYYFFMQVKTQKFIQIYYQYCLQLSFSIYLLQFCALWQPYNFITTLIKCIRVFVVISLLSLCLSVLPCNWQEAVINLHQINFSSTAACLSYTHPLPALHPARPACPALFSLMSLYVRLQAT